MVEDVKSRRRYHSRRRRAQAAQTRQDIVVAAQELFLDRGYVGATIKNIAQAAGVVVETIYRAFGSKAGLFKAVVEAAVAGGAAPATIPVEQRPVIQAMIAEPDPRRKLEMHAATQPGIHARAGPLLRVLVQGAPTDRGLARLLEQIETQRLDGMGRFAQDLLELGALRPEVSVEEARDILWTINSPSVHDLLVVQRGWSAERYRDWLASTLTRALLADVGQ